jgi:hypothetical protein
MFSANARGTARAPARSATVDPADELETAAQDLLRYLLQHPAAVDASEGIQMWWLDGRHSMATVDAVIAKLTEEGLLQVHEFVRGKRLYGLGDEAGARTRVHAGREDA